MSTQSSYVPDCSRRGGLTYQEWLGGKSLPAGFAESGFAYEYWNNLRTLDEALRNWQDSETKKRRDKFVAAGVGYCGNGECDIIQQAIGEECKNEDCPDKDDGPHFHCKRCNGSCSLEPV